MQTKFCLEGESPTFTTTPTPKPGRVVADIEELPSIKSHDPLITWSSDFDFFCHFLSA